MRRLLLPLALVIFALARIHAAVTMTVSIHKISDNSTDTQINWPAVSLPAAWVLAGDYIQLDTVMTDPSDGIQVYTDNTAADASPPYTGIISPTTQTPAGLVSQTASAQKLPTAWRISDALATPAAADPNAGGEGFLWFYHEDHAQVANNQGATSFANADPYITVENQSCAGTAPTIPCIHYAQGPSQFGTAASPNYIYLQADFRNALGSTTYKTSTLRIEAFSQ